MTRVVRRVLEGELVVRERGSDGYDVFVLPVDWQDVDDHEDLVDEIMKGLPLVRRTNPSSDGHPPREGWPLARYGRARITIEPLR